MKNNVAIYEIKNVIINILNMQKSYLKLQTFKIIWTIITIGLFFCWWNFAQSINISHLIDWIDSIEDKSTDREKFDEMVKYFCESIWSDDIYNSSESLFAYNICKDLNNPKKEGNSKFETSKWFSETPSASIIKFSQNNEWNQTNSLDQYLPWFYYNTEGYVQKLFDSIIASYTSIYQASIYWYTNAPDKSIEELIHQNFAKKHFITNPEKWEYIQICATDNEKYTYSKTCKKLKEYFYSAKNMINSNTDNYLNDTNIYKTLPAKCEKNWKNIISCWLYWWEIEYFTNLVYNEMLFYALFVDYYSYLLENKSDFKNADKSEFQDKISQNQKKIQTMNNNLERSRTATQTTIKMLKETQYSFPIHIWFLLYSEDIYKITSSMNKTLTPIYTLYDIFRNVQNPE